MREFGIRFVRQGTRQFVRTADQKLITTYIYETQLFNAKTGTILTRCPDFDHCQDIVSWLIEYARNSPIDLAFDFSIADDLSAFAMHFDVGELLDFVCPSVETTKELDLIYTQIQHLLGCFLCEQAERVEQVVLN